MKTVYLTYVFHGNMDYDRYSKGVIRRKFPDIYRMVADEFLVYPELKAQVELSGVTLESLRIWAPDVIETLKELRRRGQVIFSGSDYAAPVNVCVDGETDLASIDLGCQVIRSIVGEIDGFFAQEESYHPQLPWLLRRAGVDWVTITPELQHKNPFKLLGLDGTAITGIPLTAIDARNIEECFDAAEPDSLFCSIGDYEMPPSFTALMECIRDMETRGKKVEFTFVRDYLMRFGTKGEACYPVCAIFKENPAFSPSFSRWTSDPWDIAVHRETVRAAAALRIAETLDTALKAMTGIRTDRPLSESMIQLPTDPRTWAIENPNEYSELEARHFPQPISTLDKARHLLLWAVNSDARGWFPMLEKRYERINSFRTCAALAGEITARGLAEAKKLVDPAPAAGNNPGYTDGSLIIYNPTGARTELMEVNGPTPLGAPAQSAFDGALYHSRLLVDMPAYSIKAVPLETVTRKPDDIQWHSGGTAGNEILSLAAREDGTLRISRQGASGSDLSLALHLPEVREAGKDSLPQSRAFTSPTFTYVRHFHVPELIIYKQVDWCIHLTQTYTLVNDYIQCSWEFDFTKPLYLGRIDSGQFDPEGIKAVLTLNPATGAKGAEIWYDSPFAIPRHENRSASYLTAYTFALLQSSADGAAIVSTAGAQSFWANAESGKLGLCLGSSTLGAPASPTDMEVSRENRTWEHFDTWDREVFFGKYKHTFVIKPYVGNWKEENIPNWALSRTTPLVYDVSRDARQGSIEVLRIEGQGIRLTSLTSQDKVVKARLVELLGRETLTTVGLGHRQAKCVMKPYTIREITLD